MKVVWTQIASEDYWTNIDYILDKWTDREAIKFILETEKIISIISENPEAFRYTGYLTIRVVPIIPQISLYYRKRKGQIELVRFWNNAQDPRKLKLR